jgi:hypothetical protein
MGYYFFSLLKDNPVICDTQMNLQDIMLSDISQAKAKKDKCHTTSFICGFHNVELTERMIVASRGWGKGRGRCWAKD